MTASQDPTDRNAGGLSLRGIGKKYGSITVLNDVKSLAEQGYLAASDFPTTTPKIVKEGLAAAHSIAASSCKTR